MPTFDRKLIPGLLLLLLGIFLILDNFGVIDAWDWASGHWPLLLIGIGILWVIDPRTRGLGVAAVVVGSVFELSRWGFLNVSFQDLRRFWPLILVVVGLKILIQDRSAGRWSLGVIVLTLGVVFQLEQLDWMHIELWRLWPVVLIAVGLSMLHKALERRKRPR